MASLSATRRLLQSTARLQWKITPQRVSNVIREMDWEIMKVGVEAWEGSAI